MSEARESIMRGLNEALDHARGKDTGPAQVLLAMIARRPSLVSELLR